MLHLSGVRSREGGLCLLKFCADNEPGLEVRLGTDPRQLEQRRYGSPPTAEP
jgi:hypothetical protein